MILIVALAVGLAIAIRPLSAMGEWYAMIKPSNRSDVSRWWTAFTRKMPPQFLLIQGGIQLLSCFISPLTPALIVARLRRPRPPFRELACQPGFVASMVLCLSTILAVDLAFVLSIPALLGAMLPGGVVLVSWLILLATGRWRAEPGWIDRAGRFVGAFWLATVPWLIWVAS